MGVDERLLHRESGLLPPGVLLHPSAQGPCPRTAVLTLSSTNTIAHIHTRLQLAAGAFDFNSYMGERAKLVNKALDESLPQRYPDVLLESMR